MALPIGTRVRVLPPFALSFPGEYMTVERPVEYDPDTGEAIDFGPPGGNNWLEGLVVAFDDRYLETVG